MLTLWCSSSLSADVCYRPQAQQTFCSAVTLTDKEAVLFLTRLAALDNALTSAGTQREQWQNTILQQLYTMCTETISPHVTASAKIQCHGCS